MYKGTDTVEIVFTYLLRTDLEKMEKLKQFLIVIAMTIFLVTTQNKILKSSILIEFNVLF